MGKYYQVQGGDWWPLAASTLARLPGNVSEAAAVPISIPAPQEGMNGGENSCRMSSHCDKPQTSVRNILTD